MIQELNAPQEQRQTFVIAPNRSMSWDALALAYSGIAAPALVIALYFWIRGLTLVLPFSGLELLALGAALHVTAWRGGARDVITITGDAVRVESGRNRPAHRHDFQRCWTRVVLRRADVAWHPSRLLLCSRGREVEVGRFLNEHERRGLAGILASAIQSACVMAPILNNNDELEEMRDVR